MHFSAVLLGFAATVAAIDFRLYDNANCGGGFLEWQNVDPGMCIAYNRDTHTSGEWRAIPYAWHINAGIYRNGDCKTLVASSDIYNQNTKCISGKSFSILFHVSSQDTYVVFPHLLYFHNAN
jgi:hypothetical protein